jgi:hypothetical protein
MPRWTIKVIGAEAKDFVQEVRTRLAAAPSAAPVSRMRIMHQSCAITASSEGVRVLHGRKADPR